MAFSRSEERDTQPVSISYSPWAYPPPATTPSHLSPTGDEAGVDANAIERWLTSPAKPESTDAHTNNTAHAKNLPTQRIAGATVRRRRLQMQQMRQPSPHMSSQQERQNETPRTATLSPRASLRQSKLMKQWQHEEQTKIPPPDPVEANINVSKKPEHSRQTVAMKIAAMEKASRGSSRAAIPALFKTASSKNTSAANEKGKERNKFPFDNDHLPKSRRYDTKDETPALPGVVSIESKEEISEFDQSRDIDNKYNNKSNSPIVVTKGEENHKQKIRDQSKTNSKMDEHPDVKITRRGTSSPGIAAIRRRRQRRLLQQRHQRREIGKEDQQRQSIETTKTITVISDTQENVNDSAVVHSSLSSKTLKIPYNISTNAVPISPLARNCQIHETDCRNDFIENKIDDNCDAHDHSNATCLDNNVIAHSKSNNDIKDKPIVSVSRTKKIHLLKRHNAVTGGKPLWKSAGLPTEEVRGIDIDATPPLQNNTKQLTIHSNNNCTSTNTRRIKAALARTRSHRYSTNTGNTDLNEIGNDIGKRGSDSHSEGILKNHFQSASITSSSDIATGTSTISVVSLDSSCRSNNSRACEDDEVTTIASMSGSISDCDERDGEDVSRLSIPTELNATGVKITESSLTPSVDKYAVAMSSGNDVEELAIATLEESAIRASSALARKTAERLQELRKTCWVKLHVYDLLADDTQLDVWGCHFPLGQVFNAFNSSLHSIGTGAYHVGLEINGIEYAYGANSTRGLTGIFQCMPKGSPGYQFRTTIDFGNQAVNGREIVQKMATEYLGTDYDLLRKNCCTFAYDVCTRLGISEKDIPSWFHNLAAVGAVTQDAANYTLAPITQLFSGNELDKFTEYLNETSFNDQLEAIQDGPSDDKSNPEFIADTAYQF